MLVKMLVKTKDEVILRLKTRHCINDRFRVRAPLFKEPAQKAGSCFSTTGLSIELRSIIRRTAAHPFGASATRALFNACGVSPSPGTTYSENPAYGWVFAFLRPISVGFYHAVSSVPLRPIPHRIFSKIHFQISDNTLIQIAIFSPKAAKNALFWQSIRPGGYPAFPPDGQIASYIPFDANRQRNVL